MGTGQWNNSTYAAAKSLRTATGTSAFNYTDATLRGVARKDWKAHETLEPKGVTVRESRDSVEHPTSLAVAVLFDVTGSMHRVPRVLQEQLPKFFDHLLQCGYVEHPQVMFGAIGDAHSDSVPLQVGQFESDNRVENDLGNLVLEGGGGGGRPQESYELALYFMARHTSIDCHEVRGQKGYLFIIGDEMAYPDVDPRQLLDVLDIPSQETLTFQNILDEVRLKYEVFFVIPAGSNHFNDSEVTNFWSSALGADHFLVMNDPVDVCDVIGLQIAKNEAQIGLSGMANP